MLRTLTAGLATLALALTLVGCQQGPLPKAPEKEQAPPTDAEQKKLLEEIRAYQQSTGSTLEALAKEISRRKAVEAQAVGPSPLQRDLAVARSLLVSARRAVQSDDRDGASLYLRRLGGTLDVMHGETPAAQIRTYLERAALALQGSAAGIEADVASACILAATDVALRSPDAALVPEIAKDLEKVKAQVDKGDYKDALRAVTETAKTLSDHKSVIMLEHAAAGVRGAREAMARDAGLVVLAELDQLADLLNAFSTLTRGAPPAEAQAAEATKTGKEAPPAQAGPQKGQPAQGQPSATQGGEAKGGGESPKGASGSSGAEPATSSGAASGGAGGEGSSSATSSGSGSGQAKGKR